KRSLQLGSALDDFINAESRGMKCRRIVSQLYFNNDTAGKSEGIILNATKIMSKAATEKLGAVAMRQFGPYPFMSDDILDRLVDCIHEDKIQDLPSIRIETLWRQDRVTEFGQSLLDLILAVSPPPPPPVVTVPAVKSRAPTKCQRCGNVGHNSKFCTSFLLNLINVV
ncbi:hypothetical protein C8J56DRAFT_769041, partial [Mycena floridula]